MCNSIRNKVEFNNGTWKQSDFDECVFILDWKLLKFTDVIKLSPDFLNLNGCNDLGNEVTATRIDLKIKTG